MGLVYKVFLPSSDSDVVSRTLKLVVDSSEKLLSVSPTVNSYELPPIKEGSSVSLSIQDIDDAGNKSDWSDSLYFTAIDTIIPSTPGKASVKLVAEVADTVAPAPVTPEPPPTPPPAPEPEDETPPASE